MLNGKFVGNQEEYVPHGFDELLDRAFKTGAPIKFTGAPRVTGNPIARDRDNGRVPGGDSSARDRLLGLVK